MDSEPPIWSLFQGAKKGGFWQNQVLPMAPGDGPRWSWVVLSKKSQIHDIQFQKCGQIPCFGSTLYVQGLQYVLTQNNSLLLQKLEHGRLPKPTGGSPDVVHLIINAPQGSEWLLKAQTGLEKKESCFEIVVKICPVLRHCDFLIPFFSFQN